MVRLSSIAEKFCPAFCRPLLERIKRSTLAQRVASGAFWSVMGTGLSKAINFLSFLLVARILGAQINGQFGLVRTTSDSFVTFSMFGMGITATRYIAAYLAKDKEKVGRIIGLSYLFTFVLALIVAGVFYCIVPIMFEEKPFMIQPMRLGTLLLLLVPIMAAQTSVMMGFQDFRGLAFVRLVVSLLAAPIYLCGAWWGGLYGALTAAIIAVALNLLINSVCIYFNTKHYQIRYAFREAYKELPILWESNVPIVIADVVSVMAALGIHFYLSMQPHGDSQLGMYYFAVNFQAVMMFFPDQLMTVLMPIMSEVKGKGDEKQYWSLARKNILLTTALALIVTLPFAIFPSWFMELGGESYRSGWPILLTFCLYVLTSVFCTATRLILISRGRNWLHCLAAIVNMVAFICVASFMIKAQFGALGIVFGLITAHGVYNTIAWLGLKYYEPQAEKQPE